MHARRWQCHDMLTNKIDRQNAVETWISRETWEWEGGRHGRGGQAKPRTTITILWHSADQYCASRHRLQKYSLLRPASAALRPQCQQSHAPHANRRLSVGVCPSVFPSVRPSVRSPARPSVCLSVCLSVRPSVCQSICLSIPAGLSVCLSVRLSVHLSVRLSFVLQHTSTCVLQSLVPSTLPPTTPLPAPEEGPRDLAVVEAMLQTAAGGGAPVSVALKT